jgi:hypothetical protein
VIRALLAALLVVAVLRPAAAQEQRACSWQDIKLVEGRVARMPATSLRRDWIDLQLGPGSAAGLEACGELVGLVWEGEGRVDVRDPGPERGHILHNLYSNLPGENDLDALVLVASDGAVQELLGGGADAPVWEDVAVPLPLRALAESRLSAFDPRRQSGRDEHPPGEILWAPSPDLGGVFADLRLTGMTRQRKMGLEVTSPWIAYERSAGAGYTLPSPVRWRRRTVGSARPLLLAELPTEATMAAQDSAFAEERARNAWDLSAASVSLLVEPTYGMDKDLSSIEVVSTLHLRAAEPTRTLALGLEEGRQRRYAPSWAPLELRGVGELLGEAGEAEATPVAWSRVGDRFFVDFGREIAGGEEVTLRVRSLGQLVEPDGMTAVTPLAGWRWYPTPPVPDRHAFELVAHMPRFWRAAATGVQVEEEDDGRFRKIVSRSASPVLRGDVFLVDADATTYAPPREGLPVVRVYRSPRTPVPNVVPLADDVFLRLEHLEATLGPCPWGEIEIVERGENTYWGASAGVIPIGRADAPPEQTLTTPAGGIKLLDALAGQWIGASISARSDHDEWLIEGLRTWAACFALEDGGQGSRCGAQVKALRLALQDAMNDVDSAGPTTADWPVGAVWLGEASGWAAANQRYRGPLILHMLRMLIGEDTSRELLRRMTQTYGGQGLTTASFVLQAQRLGGQDLRRFFYGWVYATPQDPVARVTWTSARNEDGTWDLTLQGRIDDGRANTDPMPILAPLLLRVKVGDQNAWQRLVLTETESTISLRAVPEEPRGLELDPGGVYPGRTELRRAK